MKRKRINSLLAALLAVFMLAGLAPAAFADEPVYCYVHNYDELVQAIRANAEAPEVIVTEDLVYEETLTEEGENYDMGGDVINPEDILGENGELYMEPAAWVGDEYFPPELYITLVPAEGENSVEIVFGEEGITIAKNQKVFISTECDTVFYHGKCDGPLFTVESGAELNLEYSGSESFRFCAKNEDDDEWSELYKEAFISSAGKIRLAGISFNDYNAVPLSLEGQSEFQAEAELEDCFFVPADAEEIPFALKVGDYAVAELKNCEFHGYADVDSAIDGSSDYYTAPDCRAFPPAEPVEETVEEVEEIVEPEEEIEEVEEIVEPEEEIEEVEEIIEPEEEIEEVEEIIEPQEEIVEEVVEPVIEEQVVEQQIEQTQPVEQVVEQQSVQQVEQQQQTQPVEQVQQLPQPVEQVQQQTQPVEQVQQQTQPVEQQTQQPEAKTQSDNATVLDKLEEILNVLTKKEEKEEPQPAEQTAAEPVTEQPAEQPAAQPVVEEPVTQNIKVVSLWTDNQNYAGKRPDSTLVYLYKDGNVISTAKLTAADGWTHTFTDLQPGEYNISEQVIDSYTASYSTPENDRDNSILIMHYYSPATSTTTYSASGASGTTGYNYNQYAYTPAPAYTAPANNAQTYNYAGTSGAAAVTVKPTPKVTPMPTLAPAITPIPTVTPAPVTTDNTVITQASSRNNSHVGLWITLLGVSAVGCAAAIIYYLKLQKRSRRNRRH